jgi:endonuclease/exonuclease/phosphatase family metal-dependent hydrolase
MKRRSFIQGTLATLPLMSMQLPSTAKTGHRVLCANIRVALDEDEEKGVGWSVRKKICLAVIKKYNADLICLQEVLKIQAEDFKKHFPDYQLLGFDGPEMDANPVGYHGIAKNPILYSKKRYDLIAAGTYWLSETPLVAGSKSWETARARHANWVRLKDKKSGKEFRVINLHLDHVSNEAKLQQLNMVIRESGQYPVEFAQVLTGDFNSRYTSPVFDLARKEGWKEGMETLEGVKEMGFTGHAFKGLQYEKAAVGGRIDFIWYKGKAQVQKAEILRDEVKGVYPSDHFFVLNDFELS